MFRHGKCPKCEKDIDHADVDDITAGNKFPGPKYRGVSLVCPNYKTILGVSIDPMALKAETVREILEGMSVKPKKSNSIRVILV